MSNRTIRSVSVADLDAVGDGVWFLERVVLYMCGVPATSAEHKELMLILAHYAGCRYPELCDDITHILVRHQLAVGMLLLLVDHG